MGCQSAVKQAVMQNKTSEHPRNPLVSVCRETGGHAEHYTQHQNLFHVSVRRETGGNAEQLQSKD